MDQAKEDIVSIMFANMQKQLDRIEATGIKTEEHASRTNGRVNKLERYQTGIIMCGSLIFFIIIPLAYYAYTVDRDNLKFQILNGPKLTSVVQDIVDKNYNHK